MEAHDNGSNGGPTPIRVALVRDDEIVAAGLSTMLAPYCDTVRVVDLGDECVDVALVDAFAAHAANGDGGADGADGAESGLEAACELIGHPGVRHVALFSFRRDSRAVHEALGQGITGFLSKASSAPQLVDDLRRVAAGEQVVPQLDERPDPTAAQGLAARFGLTDREADVLALLVHGRRNGEIAAGLDISRNTVKTHLRAVFRKLGVETRAQAVAAALGRPTTSWAAPPGEAAAVTAMAPTEAAPAMASTQAAPAMAPTDDAPAIVPTRPAFAGQGQAPAAPGRQ